MKAYSFLCLVVTGVAFAYATASAQTTRSQTPASTTTAEGQHQLNGIVYGIDNALLPKNAARTTH